MIGPRFTVLPSLAVLAALAACGGSDPPPPASSTGRPGSAAAGSAATGAGPAMLTDEQCRARGGQIVTEETYAHLRHEGPRDQPVTPFRICRIPSPKNGASCRADADCAGGRCFCTGALARPDPENDPQLRALDGAAATGQCSDQPLPDGAWFCLVEGGHVHLNGIIVD